MRWSADFAYAVGLLVTDGSLSKDGRHFDFTSKDLDQVQTFINVLGLKNKIGTKYSSSARQTTYYHVQWGNVLMYQFMESIGLTPNKSKILSSIKVPEQYFADFLRGHLDGDGYTYSYWDPRWKSSFMLYLGFCSASRVHLEWLNGKILELYGVRGKINLSGRAYYLKFAKRDSIVLIRKMYYKIGLPCLERKYLKIRAALCIIGDGFAEVAEQADALP